MAIALKNRFCKAESKSDFDCYLADGVRPPKTTRQSNVLHMRHHAVACKENTTARNAARFGQAVQSDWLD